MLSETEIAARLPVWCALSELFVDTGFDAASAAAVARDLRASGLDLATLERILRDEVAPVFHANAVAGNWTGWPPGEVRRLVTAHLARQARPVARLTRPWRSLWVRLWMPAFEPAWQDVRARLVAGD